MWRVVTAGTLDTIDGIEQSVVCAQSAGPQVLLCPGAVPGSPARCPGLAGAREDCLLHVLACGPTARLLPSVRLVVLGTRSAAMADADPDGCRRIVPVV